MSSGYLKCAGISTRRKVYAAILGALSTSAQALPQNGNVVAGDAAIEVSAGQLDIQQTSDRAIIEYDSFSIEARETVNFHQPGASSVTLNRVTGNDLSTIHGQINANGQVYLINNNGVLFGEGAQVDVGGLVVTTLDVNNSDFMQGRDHFAGPNQGNVENRGHLDAHGRVVLAAPRVRNSGHITAGEEILLQAGNQVMIQPVGSSIPMLVDDPAFVGRVSNEGSLHASRVAMVVDTVTRDPTESSEVNNTGLVRAVTVAGQGGNIELLAPAADVINRGGLEANAELGQGGKVQVQADRYAQTGTVSVAGASNSTGSRGDGGAVKILTDTTIVLHPDSSISADGGAVGDAGEVILFSNDATWYRQGANISARGGSEGGDGGFVEVSGREFVDVHGMVDVSAVNGQGGTWYIDPINIEIVAGNSSDGVFPPGDPSIWDSSTVATDTAQIGVLTLRSTLETGGSVIINTASARGVQGNIRFRTELNIDNFPVGRSLTLIADNDIAFEGGSGIFDSTPASVNNLDVILRAGGSILLNGASAVYTGAGTFSATAAGDITVTDITSLSTSDTAVILETTGGSLLDDASTSTDVEALNGGVLLIGNTGIGNVTLNTNRLGVRNTGTGNVAISHVGDLTLTSLGLGAGMTFDIGASGSLTYTGSAGGDLDGAIGSTINLTAGTTLNVAGSLADITGEVDNSTAINFSSGGAFSMADGVTVNSGNAPINVSVGSGNGTVTGLVSASSANNAITVNVMDGLMVGGSGTDISATNGGAVIGVSNGDVNLSTNVQRLALTAAGGNIIVNEVDSLELVAVNSTGLVDITTGGDFTLPGTASFSGATLVVDAAGVIRLPDAGLALTGGLSLTGQDVATETNGRTLTLAAPTIGLSTAGTGSDSIFNTTANFLSIANHGSNSVTVNDVNALTLTNVAPLSGNISVSTAAGQILTLTGDVNLDGARGGLMLHSGADLLVDFNLADSTGPVDNNTDITLSAAGSVLFASTAQANAGTGNVAINAGTGSVVLGGVTGNAISVTAATGISDGNGAALNLTGNSAALSAGTNIGSGLALINGNLASASFDAGGDVFFDNATALNLMALAVGGNIELASGGDLDLSATTPVLLGNASFNTNGGNLLLNDAGLSLAGDLAVSAAAIADSEGPVNMTARNANLQLAAGGVDTSINSSFDALVLSILGGQTVSVSDASALTVTDISTGGSLSLSAGAGSDLTLADATPSFGANLSLAAGNDVIVPAAGVTVTGDLGIGARDLLDGDSTVSLAAANASLSLQGTADSVVNTVFGTLSLSTAGGTLTVNELDALTLNAIAAAGNVSVATGGDLTLATSNVDVAGLARFVTAGAGNLVLADTGLAAAGGLSIDAANIIDSDSSVILAATDAVLNLRDGTSGAAFTTAFTSLSLNSAGSGAVSMTDSDALTVTGLTTGGSASITATAADLTFNQAAPTVAGDLALSTTGAGRLVLSAAGLSTADGLMIDATSISDGDGNVLLAASSADLRLRNSAETSLTTSFDNLVLNVAGGNGISVSDSDQLTLVKITSDGDASFAATGADLVVADAIPSVAGRLSLSTIGSGNLIVPAGGLLHGGDLLILADHVSAGAADVTLGAGAADITLRVGDSAMQLNTALDSLALQRTGAGDISVIDVDGLQLTSFSTGGSASINTTGADLSILGGNLAVAGNLFLRTLGTGSVVLDDAGLNLAGNLNINADAVRGSGNGILLSAADANLNLRAQSTGADFVTQLNRLALNLAGGGATSFVDQNGLLVTALASDGSVSIATTGADLQLATAPVVAGKLSLSTLRSGDLVLEEAGLHHAGVLTISVDNLRDSDTILSLSASTADIALRSGAESSWSTEFEQLSLNQGGSGALAISNNRGLRIDGLAAGGNVSIDAAGGLRFSTSNIAVGGALQLTVPGDVTLASTGFTMPGSLLLQALNLVTADGSAASISASSADLTLTGNAALTLQSNLERLGLSFDAAAPLAISNSGSLILERLTAPNSPNIALAAGGTLTLPAAGLTAQDRLAIDAADLIDDDRILSFDAKQLAVRLSAAAEDSTWNVQVDRLDASVNGRADLTVNDNNGLRLADLNEDGRAVAISDGNFSLDLGSGDLHVDADVLAADASADGMRSGVIDLAVTNGNMTIGNSSAVRLVSHNTLDQQAQASDGNQYGIRLRLTDASGQERSIALGNGGNLRLTAIGGDILVDAGTSANGRVLRRVDQTAGALIEAYNNLGDALNGQVLVNGKSGLPAINQQIRSTRTLALIADQTPKANLDLLDEINDPGSVSEPTEASQQAGPSASAQFEAVFGVCNEADEQDNPRCRVNSALKAFLSHWLVGGEMPPKTEIR